VFVDSMVIDFFTNEMVLVKMNAEVDTVLAEEYHAKAYPTSLMTDKDGKEVDRIVGYRPPDEFVRILRDYSKGIGTLEDLLERAETETDRSLYLEIAGKYKYRGGADEALAWYAKVIESGDPGDSLSGESRLSVAGMSLRAKDYDQALGEFGQIMSDFEGTMFAREAEIYRAITQREKADTVAAIAAFEAFLEHYPESKDTTYARKQIAKLKGLVEEEK
jgi:tetratricopeptide (TPR) repeat protein